MASLVWKLVELFLLAFGTPMVQFATDWLTKREHQEALKRAAVDEAATRTAQDIAEVADEQAKVNAASRGRAADVARRVRERLNGRRT